jgi:hypothetical protein
VRCKDTKKGQVTRGRGHGKRKKFHWVYYGKKRTPQEKKKLSLKKDHRNAFGQNNKASRKAIPKRKRAVNKAYRKTVKQKIQIDSEMKENDLVAVDDKIKNVKRKFWKKRPDESLEKILKRKGKILCCFSRAFFGER